MKPIGKMVFLTSILTLILLQNVLCNNTGETTKRPKHQNIPFLVDAQVNHYANPNKNARLLTPFCSIECLVCVVLAYNVQLRRTNDSTF